jgi:2-succinyl-5-enolpyruvyl-6-hydroxy-3-cyclohexene-1-carboxylate synthase
LVTLGPIGPEEAGAARALSEALGAPCLSELPQAGPAASLDFLANALSSPPQNQRVRVLHIGPPCISTRWNELLKNDSMELHVLPGEQHRDPSNRAVQILQGRLLPLLKRLLVDVDEAPIDGTHNAAFRSFIESTCTDLKKRTMAALVQLRANGPPAPSIPEARAMACLLGKLSSEQQLCVANSLTLRLACWIAPTIPQEIGPIFTARGTNGIDGWIAASAGAAYCAKRPCVALIGDVTAAHDLGSLALLSKVGTPLVIVILDNSGGRIFDHLPAYDDWGKRDEWAFWRTPPAINWQNAAAAFQVPYARCDDEESLPGLLEDALRQSHATLLHVITDPSETRRFIGLADGNPAST